MGSSQASIYILAISLLLLIEKLFRLPEIQKKDIALLKEFIPIFLALFKWAVNRQVGMGMKFIKFHVLLHLSDDLNRFGPSYSSDSSAGESMHKGLKEDANHTQKNSATFDSQIAKNHSESHAINRANCEVHPPSLMAGNRLPLDAAGDDDFAVAIRLHFYVDMDVCLNWTAKSLQANQN